MYYTLTLNTALNHPKTYHFIRRSLASSQQPSVLKLEEPKNVKAGVDGSVVVVVGFDQPVITSGCSGEVNLNDKTNI